MKVSDYIVSVLERENVTDIFGIPGVGCGHFTDSLKKSSIRNHVTYHEQGAAFAACAFGQASGNIGVAYATAGPGATNLLTGIANAYVDSVPALYIVGNKDLDTLKGDLKVRQKASQEVDIVEMARPVTKWSYQITDSKNVQYALEKAIYIARNGRPGPVLLDIPSSIQRMEYCEGQGFVPDDVKQLDACHSLIENINRHSRPLFLVGGGVKQTDLVDQIRVLSSKTNIPVVASVVCDDELFNFDNYVGFFGVDGDVCANHAIVTCDLLICFGARMNIKEVGQERARFAQQAHIIRIDIDQAELDYRLGNEDIINEDLKNVIPALLARVSEIEEKETWAKRSIKRNENTASSNIAFESMCVLVEQMPEDISITVGIGSHRRWFISSRIVKRGWRIFQSAGLASMGFALPAAIGVHFATKRPVICLDGDGGLLMNVQELQLIHRENLPIAIVVFNNHCLGEIMEFQKKVFGGNYFGTTEETGYLSADFEALAAAFKLSYKRLKSIADIKSLSIDFTGPGLIEVPVPTDIEG